MSWLRMNVKTESVSGELEMDQVGSEQVSSVINGFFGAFGFGQNEFSEALTAIVPNPKSVVTEAFERSILTDPPELPIKPIKVATVATPPLPPKVKGPEPRKIDKPPLINSERTLGVSIGDQLAEAYQNLDAASYEVLSQNATETNEDFRVTGIKVRDGVPHYRCRYWCKNPECRNQGNHYITPDTISVNCHNCGEAHEVRDAVHGEHLQKDAWGNFFKADHWII